MVHFDEHDIKKLIKQDPNSFNEFYLKTVDMFFRYINTNFFLSKQDAEDVISDFYVKFWEAVKTFDVENSFAAYYWTIFKNTLKDYFKKNVDIPFTVFDTAEEEWISFAENLIDESMDLSDIMEIDFSFDRIQSSINKLDAISKDIVYMKFIEEKSNQEISELLGISQDNIRQRLSRSIKILKEMTKDI